MYFDPSGHFWKELWEGTKEVVKNIGEFAKSALKNTGKELSNNSSGFAVAGSMAVADGPSPAGDTAGLITAAGILAISAIKGVYDTATTFDWIDYSSQTKVVPKEEAESKEIDIPYLPMKKPIFFPSNPNDFQPINMTAYTYNNGKIIKWGYTEKTGSGQLADFVI